MKKIYVSGSVAFDRIMDFPGYFKDNILPSKIHMLNVSFNIDTLKENYGGTAGNIAYNLAMLGLDPHLIASAGKDFDKYKKYLEEKKINTENIKIVDNDFTAAAYIITDKADNQITGFHMGAIKVPSRKKIEKADLLIISPGNVEDMKDYKTQATKLGMSVIFDPGQTLPVLSSDNLKFLIAGSKVLVSNDYEFDLILEKTKLTETEILSMVEILITTIGEKGSTIKTKNAKFEIPAAKPMKVLDPTGAGDAYRAGIIYGLLNDFELEKVGRLGAISSVYAVEEYGTQNHKFDLNNFKKRFKENFNYEV